MAKSIWLLVEWVEENTSFPSYSVVNVNSFSYPEKDLRPGGKIFISSKLYNTPREAKIIKTSDNKQQIKEQQFLLERQDQQIKNMLQVCMRTINEIKSDEGQYGSVQHNSSIGNNSNNYCPLVITANNEDSDNECNDEQNTPRNKITKYSNQSQRHSESIGFKKHQRKDTKSPAMTSRNRSIVNSTPLTGNSIIKQTVLSFDQGTQTEDNWTTPVTAKIEELEIVLKHLYTRFQSMIVKVNNNDNGTIRMSETEENCDVSYYEETEQNIHEPWVGHKGIGPNIEIEIQCENNVKNDSATLDSTRSLEPKQSENATKPYIKQEVDRKNNNENSRVRRMSAQTTNSNEMMPIGDGHAMVPARLLNEIDWKSHTTATRQLLQAIFPRKVLATHSLTGKQSPAHRNKPAKKLLDPNLVHDIITMVSSKSGVSRNLVRSTITLKCTDEAKLYRNRQLHILLSRAEKKNGNDENVPPSPGDSSDESTNLI